MSTTVNEAVAKAAAEMGLENQTEETQVEETKVEETKVTEPKSEEDEGEAEVDRDTLEALQLYEALKDPKRAKQVVASMAQNLGLFEAETKREVKTVAKSIKDLVKEKLGPDNEFIAPILGELLEELEATRDARHKAEIEEIRVEMARASAMQEYTRFAETNNLTEDEAGVLNDLTDEFQWNGKGTLTSYLGKLLKVARVQLAEKAKATSTKQKISDNLKSKAKTVGGEANEEKVLTRPSNLTAKDAVLAALKGITYKD